MVHNVLQPFFGQPLHSELMISEETVTQPFLQQLELDKVQVLSGSRGIAWNVFPLDAYITSVC